jgi:predicted ArsR family transcriptional regulator
MASHPLEMWTQVTRQHLQVLRATRLVETRRKGVHVEYRLADRDVSRFFHALRELAESRLADIEQVTRASFGERRAMEAVQASELLRRVRSGEVTVLDVRRPRSTAPATSRARCRRRSPS